MRLIAAFCTLLALAGLGFAGLELKSALDAPVPPRLNQAVPVQQVESARSEETLREPLYWPALFGEPQPPEPPAPPDPPKPKEPPKPPQPPGPPIESLGFTLQGIVSDGDSTWAIVSHPTGDRLLRVGDSLAEGVTVTGIDASGLLLDNGGTEARLDFLE